MPSLRLLPSLMLLCLISPTLAGAPADGQLIGREPVELAAWKDAVTTTDAERYADEGEYQAAAGDHRFVLEKLWYSSGGLRVAAYACYPKSATALPVIVFNRGSYVRGEIAPELVTMFHRLAAEGFAVVAPLYRQSAGGEGKDELGGDDLADLMSVVPLARQLSFADPQAMFLYGESRGGMMVFQAIRDGFPARAASTFGAFTDFEQMTSGERGAAMAKQIWSDFADRREEIVARRSAMRWPEKLGVPLLLMHGGGDNTVDPSQTLRLALELQKRGIAYGLVVFEGDNHIVSAHRLERDRQAIQWFKDHLSRQQSK